jgi:hypothetical protein
MRMSNDPLASIVKGAVCAAIDWTEEKIGSVLAEFVDGDLKIVHDVETYQMLKEQRKSPEFSLFSNYVFELPLCQLFRIGLALRKLERNVRKRDALRTRTVKLYGTIGLHIAEFAQNGFFQKYLDIIMAKAKTNRSIQEELADFFKNFEKVVTFIKETDNVEKKANEISTRIISNMPNTYIIFSSVVAMQKCAKVKHLVMEKISGYNVDLFKTESKEVYFLHKSET